MREPELLDAILPAGGKLDPELASKVGTDVKALAKIDGKPLIESVMDALAASGRIRNTVLIGGAAIQAAYGSRATFVLDEADSGPANMFNGLHRLMSQETPPRRVLLATTDLPYVEGVHVQKFVDEAPSDKDLAVPLVYRSDFEAEYPGTSSTFVKLKDGEFTLGGMFLLDCNAMERMREPIARVFGKRKSKLGMAGLLGPEFVWRYLTHTLSLDDLEKKIMSLLGCSGVAVPGAPVQFAYDIDDWEDFSYAANRKVPA